MADTGATTMEISTSITAGTGNEQTPQAQQQHELQLPMTAPASTELTLFGWMYNEALTPDDNYLDFALAVSRNSLCEGGHMGCIFVKHEHDPPTDAGKVMLISINSTLYDLASFKSDVHAEQNAISTAARTGLSLQGTTAYITMPPCRTCFGLLQAAGVKRIVFRRKNHLPEMDAAAERLGITMVGDKGPQHENASVERVKQLWAAYRLNNPDYAQQEIAMQKQAQKMAKENRKRRAAEKSEIHQQALKKAATQAQDSNENEQQQQDTA